MQLAYILQTLKYNFAIRRIPLGTNYHLTLIVFLMLIPTSKSVHIAIPLFTVCCFVESNYNQLIIYQYQVRNMALFITYSVSTYVVFVAVLGNGCSVLFSLIHVINVICDVFHSVLICGLNLFDFNRFIDIEQL